MRRAAVIYRNDKIIVHFFYKYIRHNVPSIRLAGKLAARLWLQPFNFIRHFLDFFYTDSHVF